MKTTLNKIKQEQPPEDLWERLINFLKKTESDDEVLELKTILESNNFFGIDDAIWSLQAVEESDIRIKLFLSEFFDFINKIIPFSESLKDNEGFIKAIKHVNEYAIGKIDKKNFKYFDRSETMSHDIRMITFAIGLEERNELKKIFLKYV